MSEKKRKLEEEEPYEVPEDLEEPRSKKVKGPEGEISILYDDLDALAADNINLQRENDFLTHQIELMGDEQLKMSNEKDTQKLLYEQKIALLEAKIDKLESSLDALTSS